MSNIFLYRAKKKESIRPWGGLNITSGNYVDPSNPNYVSLRHQFSFATPSQSVGMAPYPLVIFIHGGGFNSGNPLVGPSHFSRRALNNACAWASIGYRLAPTYGFPAQIQDVKAAIRHFKVSASAYQIDPTRIGLIGYSAGTLMAAMAGLRDIVTASFSDYSLGNPGVEESVKSVLTFAGHFDIASIESQWIDIFGSSQRTVDATGSNEYELLGNRSPTVNSASAQEAGAFYWANSYVDTSFKFIHGDGDVTIPYLQSTRLHNKLLSSSINSTASILIGETHGSIVLTSITDPLIDEFCVNLKL